MNNTDVLAVREFRRFVNNYIYPYTTQYFISKISYYCDTQEINFESAPQPTIKFVSKIKPNNNSDYITATHNILKEIFVSYFNEDDHVKLIRQKIHTEVNDENISNILYHALNQIQYGNSLYMGLLFNITILNDGNISYVYL
jgi:hypothetical protein